MKDLILEEIKKLQRNETTTIVATRRIIEYLEDAVEEAVENTRDEYTEIVEDEENRITGLEHASFATGTPDLFSDEMREFWNA